MSINMTRIFYCCLFIAGMSLTGLEAYAASPPQGDKKEASPIHGLDIVIVSRSYRKLDLTPKTRFAWLFADVEDQQRFPKSRIMPIVEQSIHKAMLARGYPINQSNKLSLPDYYVAFTVALESSLDDAAIFKRYGLVPGYSSQGVTSQYEKGTLLIHIIDAKTRQTVWQSAAQGAVDLTISDVLRKQRIQTLVSRMIRGLPFN